MVTVGGELEGDGEEFRELRAIAAALRISWMEPSLVPAFACATIPDVIIDGNTKNSRRGDCHMMQPIRNVMPFRVHRLSAQHKHCCESWFEVVAVNTANHGWCVIPSGNE
jgi:hypothetical protein